jgi:hypothetical protein
MPTIVKIDAITCDGPVNGMASPDLNGSYVTITATEFSESHDEPHTSITFIASIGMAEELVASINAALALSPAAPGVNAHPSGEVTA